MNLVIPHGFEANYAVGFARGLAANKVAFTVISSDETAARLEAAGIRHVNLRRSQDPHRRPAAKIRNLLRYYAVLAATVFRHRGGTLHFNGLLSSRGGAYEAWLIPLWLRLCAGQYIHTVHNVLPHGCEGSAWLRFVYRWVYRLPHVLIAHAETAARILEAEFGVPRRRIVVMPIGLNEEVPDSGLSPEAARRELGLPPHAPLALFFGKIDHYKGLDTLIDAFGQITAPDARLAIAGWSADPECAASIRRRAAASPHASRIDFREGFVPNAQLSLWLSAADAVVLPYRHVYQSGVVFLCLRFGVPMIATNAGPLADFVPEDCGIVVPLDSGARGLAGALDHFFAARERFDRRRIAAHGQQFRWEKQCERLKPFYA